MVLIRMIFSKIELIRSKIMLDRTEPRRNILGRVMLIRLMASRKTLGKIMLHRIMVK